MSARDRLATSCGVATEYWDLGGTLRIVPETTVEQTLAALGVRASTEHEFDVALANRRKDHWEQMLPPLRVVREQVLPAVAEGLSRADKARSDVDLVVSACCAVDADGEAARRRAAGIVGFYASVRTYA